jgi:hypothetical protein
MNIEPFDVAGVDAPMIVRANDNKIDEIDDVDEDIMSIATIPPVNNPNPLVLSDTLDDNNANANDDKASNDDKSSKEESSNNNDPGTQGEIVVDKLAKDPTESEDQIVR